MKETFVHKHKKALIVLAIALLAGGVWWFKIQDTYYSDLGFGGKGGMTTGSAPEYSYVESEVAEDASFRDSSKELSTETKVIKSGSLTLHVDSVQTSVTDIVAKVESWGGYVDDSSVNLYEDSYTAWMNLRIPEDKFEQAYADLKEMANYTIYEYTNTDDITLYYTDLESRLRNYQAEEAQYLDLLDQTSSVDSIVVITQALSEVRYKIESIQGQLKVADDQVSYSTLSVSLQEDASPSSVTEKWRPISTIKEALKDWLEFLKDGVDAVIYIAVYAWPLLIVLLVYKIWKRRK
jgi:glycine cleavage system regulatory protein